MQRLRIGVPSRRLRETVALNAFFPEWDVAPMRWLAPSADGLDGLAGWGHKRYGRATQRIALRHQLPYFALEDGFVRSYDLAVRGAKPWSIVCDNAGIYYNAHQPSQLEALIAENTSDADAAALMATLRNERISKYNSGDTPSLAALGVPARYVLVVDQCMGDASVPLGMATHHHFETMLADARAHFPAHTILIKTHPDVLTGKKRGYLSHAELPKNTQIIAQDINPYALLEGAECVYCVTSLLGMEALIAGVPVRCYGAPFYAGWGLTEDTLLAPSVAARRAARPTREALFSAAYLRYARYLNPHNGAPSTLAETIETIHDVRKHYASYPRNVHAWGFAKWKQPHVVPFLVSPHGTVHFHADAATAHAHAQKDNAPMAVWAAKHSGVTTQAGPLLQVEDGFVRSHGLGSDLIAAASLVVDTEGIYFDATQPSALETILQTAEFSPELLQRAHALRQRICTAQLTKYNLSDTPLPTLPDGKEIHLVVGQVESDASIARGSPHIRTNKALLEAVRANHPNAYIVYKPHPDVVAGNRAAGEADRSASDIADLIVRDGGLAAWFERADYLHTITSLAGFEMLLRGGRVVTYGQPFYAGWGLTNDNAGPFLRRTRTVTLEMLVAAALILYPRYYQWEYGIPTTAEHTMDSIARALDTNPTCTSQPSFWRQLQRFNRWLKGCIR